MTACEARMAAGLAVADSIHRVAYYWRSTVCRVWDACEAHAVAAGLLRGVERLVGLPEQSVYVVAVCGQRRNARRRGHHYSSSVGESDPMSRKLATRSFGDGERVVLVGAAQHGEEFLTAPAPQHVRFAKCAGKPQGRLGEDGVTCLVSVRVVDDLEVVEV